jgi:hypothetical protein
LVVEVRGNNDGQSDKGLHAGRRQAGKSAKLIRHSGNIEWLEFTLVTERQKEGRYLACLLFVCNDRGCRSYM